jgi:PBSX family phage portal protein
MQAELAEQTLEPDNQGKQLVKEEGNSSFSFSFGDPEQVLATSIADYMGVFTDLNAEYYEPPIPPQGLAKIRHANAYHPTCMNFKANQVCKYYRDNRFLSREDLKKAWIDYDTFGNYYLKVISNAFRQVIGLKHVPAINMRRCKKPGRYCRLTSDGIVGARYKKGEIFHGKEYDVKQEIYGVPSWYGALQSILLDEDSTVFRRKYYVNGAHMGYIFFTRDPDINEEAQEKLKQEIKKSKAAGNFRSMYINIPEGDKDAVQIIPVGDISTKDEFERVKKITRNDMLSAHRVYPELAAIVTEEKNSGDFIKINQVYYENETVPMQQVFLAINELFPPGANPITFKEPDFSQTTV